MSSKHSHSSWSIRLAAAGLVVLGALAYANSLTGVFLFDDYSCIHGNPRIHPAHPETALAGRPLPALLTLLNYRLGGLNPLGYHLANLLLHLLNALLLFGLIRRTLLTKPLSRRWEASATHFAFFCAALWMAHPLATEAVNYVVQRTELMFAASLLLMLYSLVRSAAGPGHRLWWQAAAVAACAAGMLSKEVMAVAPLLAVLYDRVFLSSSWKPVFEKRGRLHAALALAWVILLASLLQSPRVTTASFSAAGITPWEYWLTQSSVIVHYLRLSLWPHPLVLDYADWPVAQSAVSMLPYLAIVAGLLWLTLRRLRQNSPAGFLGAWFFLILAPTSSFMPIATEIAAERRMYLPLAALVVFAVAGLQQQLPKRTAGMLFAAVVALFCALTVSRNSIYRTEQRMLQDILAKRPGNFRALYNLGIVFREQGNAQAAERAFRQALRLKPDYGEAHNNLGVLLMQSGRKAEAVECFEAAVRFQPGRLQPQLNLRAALEND